MGRPEPTITGGGFRGGGRETPGADRTPPALGDRQALFSHELYVLCSFSRSKFGSKPTCRYQLPNRPLRSPTKAVQAEGTSAVWTSDPAPSRAPARLVNLIDKLLRARESFVRFLFLVDK